jgi:hypothetical protein
VFHVSTSARMRAHRYSWQIAFGEIPSGLCVLHRCDNPSCVRHDHLFLGTQAENMRDRIRKGRTLMNPDVLAEEVPSGRRAPFP